MAALAVFTVPTLSTLKDLLAVIGGVALIATPLLRAYLRSVIHGALEDAPVMIRLTDRVKAVEATVAAHADEVKVIPQLAVILERMERTLDQLNATLVRAGLSRLEG